MLARFFNLLTDDYARTARLSPAILTVFPIAWTAMSIGWASFAISLTLSLPMMTLLANLARSRGKILEDQLNAKWGGWRTTTLLRHSDPSLEKPTKERYHAQLTALCGEPAPTRAEEASSPNDADGRYRSLTRKFLELRRDPKYKHVHSENAQYGFRRNLLGLKPTAIWIILACAAVPVVIVAHRLAYEMPTPQALEAVAAISWLPFAALAFDVIALAVWGLLIDETFVRQAADEYAVALFRTLDEP